MFHDTVENPYRTESISQVSITFPCSSAQQLFVFLDTIDPGNPALNVAMRWSVRGSISIEVIQKAFHTVIARHEALRTRFKDDDGVPVQEVLDSLVIRPTEIDLTQLPLAQQEEEALRLGRLEAEKRFDLSELPLLRVCVLRLQAHLSIMLVTVHHTVFDAQSIRLLSDEFGTAAAAHQTDTPPQLPELPIQYGDYASWQSSYLDSSAYERDRDYWVRRLSNNSYFEIPSDFDRSKRAGLGSAIVAHFLSGAIGQSLERAPRAHKTTLFSFACASIAATLHRHSGSHQISIGTQISGRVDPDLESVIGCFVNSVVLKFDIDDQMTFRQLLTNTQETVQEAVRHQSLPFHILVEKLKIKRDSGRTPLVSVNFTMLKNVVEHTRFDQFELSGLPSLPTRPLHDLNFFLVKWPNLGWRLALEYDKDLFARSTAETLLTVWKDVLESILKEPNADFTTLSASRVVPIDSQATEGQGGVQEAASVREPSRMDDVEQQVIQIWEDLLDLEGLHPESNFFDCGGHSLLAMRMLSRVTNVLGCRIHFSTLISAPTVREFADRIKAHERPLNDWNIVPIQPKGSNTPIIAINNTGMYYRLSRDIGFDRSFLSIQTFDPNSPRDLPHRSLESIVEDYVRFIRIAQPQGPYVLIGFCMAGTIAFEAARQLRQVGEAVPLVILADSIKPNSIDDLSPLKAFLWRMSYRVHVAKHHFSEICKNRTNIFKVLYSYRFFRKTRIFDIFGFVKKHGLGREDWENRWFLPHLEAACKQYTAEPMSDTLIILASDELKPSFAGENFGWHVLDGGNIVFRRIPGWHSEMFGQSGSKEISNVIRPFLEKIDERLDLSIRPASAVTPYPWYESLEPSSNPNTRL